MADKQEFTPINSKALLRKMMACLPRRSGEDNWASHLIIALYSYSNTFFDAKLVEKGILDFTAEASYDQLAEFMGMTRSGAKQCCERMKEKWGAVLTSKRGKYSNHFEIRLRESAAGEAHSESSEPIEQIEIAFWDFESAFLNRESAFLTPESASPEAPLSLICRLLSSSSVEKASGGSAQQNLQDKTNNKTSGTSSPNPNREATQTSRTHAARSAKAGSSVSPARATQEDSQ